MSVETTDVDRGETKGNIKVRKARTCLWSQYISLSSRMYHGSCIACIKTLTLSTGIVITFGWYKKETYWIYGI